MPYVFLVWLLLCGGVATVEAETFSLSATKPIDVGELLSEAKRSVPQLTGVTQENTTLHFTGTFTAADEARLRQALTQHDATSREQRRTSRQAARHAAKVKLQALGLTLVEVDALFP